MYDSGQFLWKTLTKVEFPGQNDDNNRIIKESMTVASRDISDETFFKP